MISMEMSTYIKKQKMNDPRLPGLMTWVNICNAAPPVGFDLVVTSHTGLHPAKSHR
jgi:hypothetical protein